MQSWGLPCSNFGGPELCGQHRARVCSPVFLRHHTTVSDSCWTVLPKLEHVVDREHRELWPGLLHSKDTQDGSASHNLAHAATVPTSPPPSSLARPAQPPVMTGASWPGTAARHNGGNRITAACMENQSADLRICAEGRALSAAHGRRHNPKVAGKDRPALGGRRNQFSTQSIDMHMCQDRNHPDQDPDGLLGCRSRKTLC